MRFTDKFENMIAAYGVGWTKKYCKEELNMVEWEWKFWYNQYAMS